jgi:hypothetical protein
MGALMVLAVLVVCALWPAYGARRDLDDRDRGGWWPGTGRR